MRNFRHVTIAISLILAVAITETYRRSAMVDEAPKAVAEGGFPFEPYVSPRQRDFPELYSTEAVIVLFGSASCRPCQRTKVQLKPHAADYNMVFYDISKSSQQYNLMKDLKLGSSVPVIAIIEKGKVKKVFQGYTPWDNVKPYATKAKKSDTDPVNIRIGPLKIDIDDGDVDIHLFNDTLRDRIQKDRIRRQDENGGRFEDLRVRVEELWTAATAWVIENWDTIARIAALIFILL